MDFVPTFASILSDFIANLLAAAIVAVLSSLFVVRWIREKIQEHNVGIRHMHPLGSNIKNMKKAIASADEICLLAVGGNGFMDEHKAALQKRLNAHERFAMRLLLVNPQSDFSWELQQTEKRKNKSYNQELLNNTLNQLQTLHLQHCNHTENEPCFYKHRMFNTHFRNPIVICKGQKRDKVKGQIEYTRAWITITMPKKVAGNSPTFELNEDKSKECYDYYNELWDHCDPAKKSSNEVDE